MDKEDILKVIGGVALIILSIFIAPWLLFWISYFGGWVAKLLIGKYLVEGFTYFNINIPIDKIPLIAGCIGWIGGFFKTSIKYNRNKD